MTLEGPDGGGKTTQAERLVSRLEAEGYRTLLVHEPGGTDLGQHIRALLLGRSWVAIDPWAEALLFSACRAQLVAEVIKPALEQQVVVVADRFADSTLAYQGAGRGLPMESLKNLVEIATQGVRADLTILLDVPAHLGIARHRDSRTMTRAEAGRQLTFFEEISLSEDWNRFEDEAMAFHHRVQTAYLDLASREPDRWVQLDATGSIDEIADRLWRIVTTKLTVDASALSPIRERKRGGLR